MKKKWHRRQYFVEPELQFWFILILVLVVTMEGIFVGYGISRLLAIASDWRRSHMVADFFKTLILILFPLIGVNFVLGMYFSHKIAGPLFRLRKILWEIKEGNLSHILQPRKGDILKDFFKEFNETVFVLNRLIHRDRGFIKQALTQINQCQEILNRKHSKKELEKVQKMFTEIKSSLVVVNSHFTSSPHSFPEEKDDQKENNSDS